MSPCRRALLLAGILITSAGAVTPDPEVVFVNPPADARPRVMWMWMGSNISKEGITHDLEALKDAGFGGAMMFALSDICNPWGCPIKDSPTPEIVAFTDPWWKLVRHAAAESQRLGLDFGMGNCPGYETSGGKWIKPEYSMQEVIFSETPVKGPRKAAVRLKQPKVDLRANQTFPVVNPTTGATEKPVVEERGSFYQDIAVVAIPATGVVEKSRIVDLTNKMKPDGSLDWDAPAGDWKIYRFGYTTKGKLIQPAQWEAQGLECDKMSAEAVTFHIKHVLDDVKKYLGEYVGKSFTNLHFDSYEAGIPSWTPRMREEFKARRGYDLLTFLPVLAKREIGSTVESAKFQEDFKTTISDLYRDVYYPTLKKLLNEAGMELSSEPYGGPWKIEEIVPQLDRVLTEFWTRPENASPYGGRGTLERAAWASGKNIIEAEAFTGKPELSQWNETPNVIKREGDAAFASGVNRMMLHQFAHQRWSSDHKPGMVMGQWGTHFTQNQTWWEPGKAWVSYLSRCQALLQWGKIVVPTAADFAADRFVISDGKDPKAAKAPSLRALHRKGEDMDLYFVANLTPQECSARCTFDVAGLQPELWDPVWGTKRQLTDFEIKNGKTLIPLKFAPLQSSFVVFRKKLSGTNSAAKPVANFPNLEPVGEVAGLWQVRFDPKWGGPEKPVTFEKLQDWTLRPEPGIRYFSGTATYLNSFDQPANLSGKEVILDLGVVQHLARVYVNGRDLGVVWTAPWQVKIPEGILELKANQLKIEVTNVWANRLIGDEQEPSDCEWTLGARGNGSSLKKFPAWFLKEQPRPSKGRYCFTTWNFFTKDSPLTPSGLIGPVSLKQANLSQDSN